MPRRPVSKTARVAFGRPCRAGKHRYECRGLPKVWSQSQPKRQQSRSIAFRVTSVRCVPSAFPPALTVDISTPPFRDSGALLRASWGFHTVFIHWPNQPRLLNCRAHVVQADHLTATPVLRFQKCIPPWPLLNSFVSLQDFLPVTSAGVSRRPRTVALSYSLGQSSVTSSNSNGRRSFAECNFSNRISPTTRE